MKLRGRPTWIDELSRQAQLLNKIIDDKERREIARTQVESEVAYRTQRSKQEAEAFPIGLEHDKLVNEQKRLDIEAHPLEQESRRLGNARLREVNEQMRSERGAQDSFWRLRAGLDQPQGPDLSASNKFFGVSAPQDKLGAYTQFKNSPAYTQLSNEQRGIFDDDFSALEGEAEEQSDRQITLDEIEEARELGILSDKPLAEGQPSDYEDFVNKAKLAKTPAQQQRVYNDLIATRKAFLDKQQEQNINQAQLQGWASELEAAKWRLPKDVHQEAFNLLWRAGMVPFKSEDERKEFASTFNSLVRYREPDKAAAAKVPKIYVPGVGNLDDTHGLAQPGFRDEMTPEAMGFAQELAELKATRMPEYREIERRALARARLSVEPDAMETAQREIEIERRALVQAQLNKVLSAKKRRSGPALPLESMQSADPELVRTALTRAANTLRGQSFGAEDLKAALAIFGLDASTLTEEQKDMLEAMLAPEAEESAQPIGGSRNF